MITFFILLYRTYLVAFDKAHTIARNTLTLLPILSDIISFILNVHLPGCLAESASIEGRADPYIGTMIILY